MVSHMPGELRRGEKDGGGNSETIEQTPDTAVLPSTPSVKSLYNRNHVFGNKTLVISVG